MFSNFDGILMSMKKDGFGASGGFLAHQDDDIFQKAQNLAFFTEGFETYGGLAGRDLESLAIGMDEVLDQNYLKHRWAFEKITLRVRVRNEKRMCSTECSDSLLKL